jgi:hypothetical protein
MVFKKADLSSTKCAFSQKLHEFDWIEKQPLVLQASVLVVRMPTSHWTMPLRGYRYIHRQIATRI